MSWGLSVSIKRGLLLPLAAGTLLLCSCSKPVEHYGFSVTPPAKFEAVEGLDYPKYSLSDDSGDYSVVILKGSNENGYTPEEYAAKTAEIFERIDGVTVDDLTQMLDVADCKAALLKITVERTAPETTASESQTETEAEAEGGETTVGEKVPVSEIWLSLYIFDGTDVINVRTAAPLAEAEKYEEKYMDMFGKISRAESTETTADPYESITEGTLPELETQAKMEDIVITPSSTDTAAQSSSAEAPVSSAEAQRIELEGGETSKAENTDEIIRLG